MTDLNDVIMEYADDLAELQHKIEILQEENARLKAALAPRPPEAFLEAKRERDSGWPELDEDS